MDDSILLETELLKNGVAKCPKCADGKMKPEFPYHQKIYDYTCEKCGYHIHFEPVAIVE